MANQRIYDHNSIEHISKAIKEKRWGYVHYACEEYMEKYPKDNFIILIYVNILLKLGRTEKAREIFNEVKLAENELSGNISNYFYAMVNILLQEEKYQECLDYLNANDNLFLEKEHETYVRTYCKQALGLPITAADLGRDKYTYDQIINYSEEAAIRNIYNKNTSQNKKAKASFADDFDIEKCFHIVRSRIPISLKLSSGPIFYNCVFKADNCGIYDGVETDLITAKCLLHTDKILSLYPSRNFEKQKFIDITNAMQR